jgi:hypothetical protein
VADAIYIGRRNPYAAYNHSYIFKVNLIEVKHLEFSVLMIGVVQGTYYYYFVLKKAILEALCNKYGDRTTVFLSRKIYGLRKITKVPYPSINRDRRFV